MDDLQEGDIGKSNGNIVSGLRLPSWPEILWTDLKTLLIRKYLRPNGFLYIGYQYKTTIDHSVEDFYFRSVTPPRGPR